MNEKKTEYHTTRLSSSLGDGDGWFGNPGMEPDNRAVPPPLLGCQDYSRDFCLWGFIQSVYYIYIYILSNVYIYIYTYYNII